MTSPPEHPDDSTVPPTPALPEVDSPPAQDVLEGTPSTHEIIEQAQSVEEIVQQQPDTDELLRRRHR